MESPSQGPSLVRQKEKERRDLISTALWSGVISSLLVTVSLHLLKLFWGEKRKKVKGTRCIKMHKQLNKKSLYSSCY